MAIDPEKEFEGLKRTHDLDDPKFIAFVKKIIKDRTIRINTYAISTITDGKMLKLGLEKYVAGKRIGSARIIKGYLSATKSAELEKLLDAVPKKTYQDTRTKENMERPLKIDMDKSQIIAELDLDNLFE